LQLLILLRQRFADRDHLTQRNVGSVDSGDDGISILRKNRRGQKKSGSGDAQSPKGM
jgi:hypothetical protein